MHKQKFGDPNMIICACAMIGKRYGKLDYARLEILMNLPFDTGFPSNLAS